MPEYLAPGVYVEETSFRAKSIEGVSTSTTAFVGPTRRGPFTGTPELVTSYADFERIYGGIGPVHGGENYLAHGVRAYFNEGGARLYVSRVFTPAEGNDGRARSGDLLARGEGDDRVAARFVARFPGAAGNGRISLRKVYQPASPETMEKAHEGTFLRTGGEKPSLPARVPSRLAGPFALDDGQTLKVTAGGGAEATVTFRGEAAEAVSGNVADPLDLSAATDDQRTLKVTLNGGTQVAITADAQSYTLAELVALLGERLPEAVVEVRDGTKIAIRTRRKGIGASVAVEKNARFGFGSNVAGTPKKANAQNNVEDLNAVSVADLDRLLQPHGVRAGFREGKLELSTTAIGAAASLRIGEGTANPALGLAAHAEGAPDTQGSDGAGVPRRWFVRTGDVWRGADGPDLNPNQPAEMKGGADFVTLLVETEDADGNVAAYEGLHLGEAHPRFLGSALAPNPSRRADWLEQAYAFEGSGFSAHALHDVLFKGGESTVVEVRGGGDGVAPTPAGYEVALRNLYALEDISIVAAPGHTAYAQARDGIQRVLVAHVERARAYQVAVLDTPPEQTVGGAREARSHVDSKYAAMYWPWVTVANPQWRPGRDDVRREIDVPPSAFVAGIYARNDVQRGVHKAPANEVVRGALRFERDVNFDEQGVLNPIGVNCLRFFPGRGYRVWGARTVSSDPEWKYVSVRRYFNYVERSVDVGTQWAVFEPNGEALWANVRQTISSFLYNEWRNGALLGTDPAQAYFVRCDRSTMTQNDLDNGRLVCLIGMAVVKPAEFVIFRIGQKTADARD